MGSKDTTSTQSTENKPPAWAAPLFSKSASEAMKIYNSGAGGNVYGGQTVADLGKTTQGGIQGVQNAASNWNMPNYGNMLSSAQQPTSAASNLSGMASGNNLMSNPYFESALQGQLDSTAAQVQSQFSGAGRYGSGANVGVLTNSLGNIRANALSDQYNRDTQNMLAANSQIDNSNAQSIASQLGIGNQAFQNQLAGSQAQIGAGQVQDQNSQAKLQADYQKWLAQDMQPWTRLGLLQSAAAGSAGNYGTQKSVMTQSQPFNGLQAAGTLGSLFMK